MASLVGLAYSRNFVALCLLRIKLRQSSMAACHFTWVLKKQTPAFTVEGQAIGPVRL